MSDSTAECLISKLPPSEPGQERPAGRRLTGRVVPRKDLSTAEEGAMYALLRRYFTRSSRAKFQADLAEKESVILLSDLETGRLSGFSTLMTLQGEAQGRAVSAIFSGDTIIAREYWGEPVLARLWAGHVFSIADRLDAAVPVYWFLICSGYKTYRFLPVFFREFFPSCRGSTPTAVKELLDSLARSKFPREYDPAAGVVRLADPSPLREGVAEITPERLRDRHIAFFAEANPGCRQGDELACLAEISRANLTPAGARMLGAGR